LNERVDLRPCSKDSGDLLKILKSVAFCAQKTKISRKAREYQVPVKEGKMKFVIIGGDAAGMSAASRAKRRQPKMDVTVLEQTSDVSYSA
jgi:NADPH-dependent glutamate synthase beta subunit-like oxidoreductase